MAPLMKLQVAEAKKEHDGAIVRYETIRLVSIFSIVVGLVLVAV
jgi:hypothetical protein